MNGQSATFETSPAVSPVSAWTLSKVGQLFGLAGLAGGVLAVLGPFGTFSRMNPPDRVLFWSVVLLSAAAVHIPALWLCQQAGRRLGIPAVVWVIGAAALAALPSTVLLVGVIALLYGTADPQGFVNKLGYVFAISLPMQWLSYGVVRSTNGLKTPAWMGRNTSDAHSADGTGTLRTGDSHRAIDEDEAPTPPPVRAPLWDRVPNRLGTDLMCLEMNDHYVRVHTDRGSVLIHGRMSDAEALVAGIEGLRVHRSWWVARAAARRLRKEGRRLSIELSNGTIAPVSRASAAALKRSGWTL